MALILKVNEAPYEEVLTQLEDFQALVGGFIEIINLADGSVLIVNELGRLLGLPLNDWATDILNSLTNHVDTIVGDAAVVYAKDIEYTDGDFVCRTC